MTHEQWLTSIKLLLRSTPPSEWHTRLYRELRNLVVKAEVEAGKKGREGKA